MSLLPHQQKIIDSINALPSVSVPIDAVAPSTNLADTASMTMDVPVGMGKSFIRDDVPPTVNEFIAARRVAPWRARIREGATAAECMDAMIAEIADLRNNLPLRPLPPFGSKRKAAMAIYQPPFKARHGYVYDSQSHMVSDQGGHGKFNTVEGAIAAQVRGWGRIGYMPNAGELQDEVCEMLADALNAYYANVSKEELASGAPI